MRIAVLASHGGSLLQAVIDACRRGTIPGKVALVISNNRGSGALERAAAAGVPALHLSSVTHPDPAALDHAIASSLAKARTDMVVLAGYMKRLGPETLRGYRGRMINTHPALLPRYGGQGFFGSRVHAAVLAAGDTETGATVHYVEGDYDTGPVIAQRRLPIAQNDTVEKLEERVKALERTLLVETLTSLARDIGTIRVLGHGDLDELRRVRLTALKGDPASFSSSYEVELAQPDKFLARLDGRDDNRIYGAFLGGRLIGIGGFHRETAPKRRHAGIVTGMYVEPAQRGRGIARRLLVEIIEEARALDGLEQIELSVTAGNEPARALYESLGFVRWGVQPNALRVDGLAYAEEHMLLRLRDSDV
jgi:phosphoribosylglycinamide formyltransferase-1